MNRHDTDMTGSAMAGTRTMPIVRSALRRDLTRSRIVLTDSRSQSEERRMALADHLVWMMTFLDRHHDTAVNEADAAARLDEFHTIGATAGDRRGGCQPA